MQADEREDTPESLKAKHLRELVQSEGWKILEDHAEQAWGPEAQLRYLDAALRTLKPGDDAGERMTSLQIRAAAKAVAALMVWPSEAIGAAQPKGWTARFSNLRRLPR